MNDKPRRQAFVFTQAWFTTLFAHGSGGSRIIAVIYAQTKLEAISKFVRSQR